MFPQCKKEIHVLGKIKKNCSYLKKRFDFQNSSLVKAKIFQSFAWNFNFLSRVSSISSIRFPLQNCDNLTNIFKEQMNVDVCTQTNAFVTKMYSNKKNEEVFQSRTTKHHRLIKMREREKEKCINSNELHASFTLVSNSFHHREIKRRRSRRSDVATNTFRFFHTLKQFIRLSIYME